jgi:teichuronic acid biosynthesis glycosyltransferase TuaC
LGKFEEVRIAVLTTSYPLAAGQAAGHFVQAEVERLCAGGHDVLVVAPGPRTERQGQLPTVWRIAGHGLFGAPGALPRLRQNPLRARGALSFFRGARRLLRQHGPFDQIIAHWLIPCAWPIASAFPGPLEVVAHGSDVRLLCALPRPVRLVIARGLMRREARLRLVSEQLRETLIAATTSELRPYTRVEPSPLDIGPRADRQEFRRRMGIPDMGAVALCVARLVPEKRVESALGALYYLPGVNVVVIGGGPLLEPLRQRFPAARFTGVISRPEALDWIAAADVLVSASLLEGAPTAVREARALGVPVVACAAGDLTRWAEQDPELWLVETGLHAVSPPGRGSSRWSRGSAGR